MINIKEQLSISENKETFLYGVNNKFTYPKNMILKF